MTFVVITTTTHPGDISSRRTYASLICCITTLRTSCARKLSMRKNTSAFTDLPMLTNQLLLPRSSRFTRALGGVTHD
jgi:hypothetical protein